MNKKSTPAISIVLYVIGILFLAVSAFMLVLAINYTRTYIESYDASFADMWSNSLQYIIKEFAPYLGIGIVCIGAGVAIKEAYLSRVACAEASDIAKAAAAESKAAAEDSKAAVGAVQSAVSEMPKEQKDAESVHPDYIKAIEKLEAEIKYLENDINATREVLSIKIEEKEKRDAYRIRGLGADVISLLEGTQEEIVEIKPIPLFRVAQTMAMPDIPQVAETKPAKKKTKAKKTTKAESGKTSKAKKTAKAEDGDSKEKTKKTKKTKKKED